MSAPVNPLTNTTMTEPVESTESKDSTESKQSKQMPEDTQAADTKLEQNKSRIDEDTTDNTENKTETEVEKKNDSKSESNSKSNSKSKAKCDNENENEIEIKRCPHAKNIKRKVTHFRKIDCDKCRGNAGNERVVFCLSCFKLNCSRDSENQHGLNHWVGSRHHLCLTIPTFEEYSEYSKDIILEMMTIWCYKCDQFLHESDQDNTPKITKVKCEIYGCLNRSYKNAVKFF